MPDIKRAFFTDAANLESEGKAFLVRCPICQKENYAPNVATGQCTWCVWGAYIDVVENTDKV